MITGLSISHAAITITWRPGNHSTERDVLVVSGVVCLSYGKGDTFAGKDYLQRAKRSTEPKTARRSL